MDLPVAIAVTATPVPAEIATSLTKNISKSCTLQIIILLRGEL
jgi:hypothetical protein